MTANLAVDREVTGHARVVGGGEHRGGGAAAVGRRPGRRPGRTGAGLWIASDNQANTDTCAGQPGHMGICFLPA